MADIRVTGFDDLIDFIEEMDISESLERRALYEGGTILRDRIESKAPDDSGTLKGKITGKTNKNRDGELTYRITIGAHYGGFLEWGTSQSKKNIGWMERTIKETEDDAIEKATEIILKGVGF